MFDKAYFDDHFRRQFGQLGTARGTVVLHNGKEFSVKEIDVALDGYVLLVVYPDDGVSDKTKQQRRKQGGTQEVFWDRIAVAYEFISHVELSVSEPDKENRLGFETST